MGARPWGGKGTTCSLEDNTKKDDGELQQQWHTTKTNEGIVAHTSNSLPNHNMFTHILHDLDFLHGVV